MIIDEFDTMKKFIFYNICLIILNINRNFDKTKKD